uniref:Uncharacterized protein n=1 Tax=Fagus sylvatica TaxID=28930 RepID=A0A2N9IDJ6_FAGSY
MDSFSSSPSTGSQPQFSSEQFKDQLKTQLAQAYAEEFLELKLNLLQILWPNESLNMMKWIDSDIHPVVCAYPQSDAVCPY